MFQAEPAATAYVEIHPPPGAAAMSAVFELVSAPGGAVLAAFPGQLSKLKTGYMAVANLPLTSVPEGDTLVRARVTVDGSPVGGVVRTLRKSGR